MIIQYTNAYLLFEEDEVRELHVALSPSGPAGRPKPAQGKAKPRPKLYLEEWYAKFRKREMDLERARQSANKQRAKQVEETFNEMVVQGLEQRRKAAIWTTVLMEL